MPYKPGMPVGWLRDRSRRITTGSGQDGCILLAPTIRSRWAEGWLRSASERQVEGYPLPGGPRSQGLAGVEITWTPLSARAPVGWRNVRPPVYPLSARAPRKGGVGTLLTAGRYLPNSHDKYVWSGALRWNLGGVEPSDPPHTAHTNLPRPGGTAPAPRTFN